MGGRDEEVSDTEILKIFYRRSDRVLSTKEVADELGFSRRGTHPRLQNLVDAGLLNAKRVGRSKAYWLSDAGEDFLGVTDEE